MWLRGRFDRVLAVACAVVRVFRIIVSDAVGCSFLMVKIVKKLDSVRYDVWVCIVENKRVYVSYMPCFMFVLMYTVTEGRSC